VTAFYTMRNGIELTVGRNNILDEDPPIGPDLADDSNVTLHGSSKPLESCILGGIQFNFSSTRPPVFRRPCGAAFSSPEIPEISGETGFSEPTGRTTRTSL
jgi:hypothetical protein